MTDVADRYRMLATEQGVTDSVRASNRLHEEIQREYLVLRATPEGRHAILALLEDESPNVRLSAAAHAMSFAPDAGRPALEALAQHYSRSIGFNAQMVIEQFDKGKLNLDWVPRERSRSKRLMRVTTSALNSALTIHGLIMNGGLEHAWDVDPIAFAAADITLRAIGRKDAAMLIYASGNALAGTHDRTASERVERLTIQYYALPDVQESIENVDPES